MTREEMIALFREGHEKHGGRLSVIEREQLNTSLIQYLKNGDTISIQKTLEDELGLSELIKNFDLESKTFVIDPQINKEDLKNRLAETSVSITNCMALIAFSGTCVMSSGHHGSRLMSLLPERHIVIANMEQLLYDLSHFFGKFPDLKTQMGSNLFFVTGPSRTADIEKVLVRGIHGPMNFDIILLN